MSKCGKTEKLKGQIAFEFIIILAVVLLLLFALMDDFFEESTDTFVVAATRQTSESMLMQKAINNHSCSNAFIESISLDSGSISIRFSKCPVNAVELADKVEQSQCNFQPNSDSVISCGVKDYTVVVS